jgi:hypothetical protein
VLDCVATDTDDATVDPRWGRVGKQKIVDTGSLASERMETIDEDSPRGRSPGWKTPLAAAGNPDVTQQLLKGTTVNGKKFNVHLDGYNMIPHFSGQTKDSPREFVMYFSDDGDVLAVRLGPLINARV